MLGPGHVTNFTHTLPAQWAADNSREGSGGTHSAHDNCAQSDHYGERCVSRLQCVDNAFGASSKAQGGQRLGGIVGAERAADDECCP